MEHILKDHQGVILSCNFGGNSVEYLASAIDARKVLLWKTLELPINDVDGKQPKLNVDIKTNKYLNSSNKDMSIFHLHEDKMNPLDECIRKIINY